VVEGSLAVVEDSGFVGGPVGGIDSDGNRSSNKGSSQIIAVLNVSETRNLEGTRILRAGSLDCLVGILILVDDSVILNEFEGVIHKTSVAGLVSV
jgi:hypothetical protein